MLFEQKRRLIMTYELLSIRKDLLSIRKGKVRDIYQVLGTQLLLFNTTDRVSVNDTVIGSIPGRGRLLNLISAYWKNMISLYWFIGTDSSNDNILEELRKCDEISIVKKAILIPCEIIVRRYLTGSLYKSYLQNNRKEGIYLGVDLSAGLKEWDQLPKAVITPTTKAPFGEKDKPILFNDVVLAIKEVMKENSGFFSKTQRTPESYAKEIFVASLSIFGLGSIKYSQKGIILVDTKFEFGFIRDDDDVVSPILIDEVLTPDSSRLISKDEFDRGIIKHSSKQTLRDWVAKNPDQKIPAEIQAQILGEYADVFVRIALSV